MYDPFVFIWMKPSYRAFLLYLFCCFDLYWRPKSKLQEELIHIHVQSQIFMKNAEMPSPRGSHFIVLDIMLRSSMKELDELDEYVEGNKMIHYENTLNAGRVFVQCSWVSWHCGLHGTVVDSRVWDFSRWNIQEQLPCCLVVFYWYPRNRGSRIGNNTLII